jgi:hypothetical protein
MKMASDDPYHVAHGLATAAFGACARGRGDYLLMMSAHLAASDNAGLLATGFLHMGAIPGGEETFRSRPHE